MTEEPLELQRPQMLSPCSSGRRRAAGDSSSPEFEFWMVRNPSFPQPNLLSADELFSDGVLLPLHLLQPHSSSDDPNPSPTATAAESEPESEREPSGSDHNGGEPGSTPGPSSVLPVLSAPAAPTISSKRWKDIIFKKTDRRNSRDDNSLTVKEKDKERRKEKKGTGVGVSGGNNPLSAAELNINIWPFSRSRSAGNGGSRPRMAAAGATRKVSSAPCSRSNSAGESKSRKWPSSPSRGGVHLGRSSPVWQVRRAGGSTGKGVDVAVKNAEKPVKKEGNECRRKATTGAVSSGGGGAKPKVLQLNVPMCIGYRHHLSCRSDENSAVSVAAAAAAATAGSSGDGGGIQRSGNSSDEGIRGSSNLFNFRNLFTKKVH